jgi:hypothetical protein
MSKDKLNQLRGQKSTISRQYNKRIKEAIQAGNVASANSLKGAKTVKLREVEQNFA